MENLKIRVLNDQESKEAQELFFELGGDFYFGGKACCNTHLSLVTMNKDGLMANIELDGFDYKEITMPELRDMVVFKRNDVNDANAYCHDNDEYYYISSNGEYFYYLIGDQSSKWMHSSNHISYLKSHVKPIEKGMKEYLDPKKNYELCLSHDDLTKEGMVGVPDGAEIATKGIGKVNFWKNQDREFYFNSRGEWSNNCGETLSEYLGRNPTVKTVWQRTTQNKEIEKAISNAWDIQVGGNHYKQFKIQPMQFALENKLDAAQQNVIKYIMRHRFKNGKQDLEKAKHYIDLMIEFYYGENKNG